MSEELVKVEQPVALRHELSVEEVIARIQKVHQTMEKAMVPDHHYGVIPGTKKPTLLKPGAELLNVMFRLDPEYTKDELREPDGHLTVTSTCTLWHIPTGQRMGSGQGSCSTRESKYAWRESQRVCPQCGKPAIIKGKAEYGGGWLCFKKKEGCGAKFKDGDDAIESQVSGRVPNPDLPDTYNTVLKMANKRSLVAAVLNVTAASDIFTQDLEDLPDPATVGAKPVPRKPQETVDEQGDRLFRTPEEIEHDEKVALLEPVAKGFQLLGLSSAEQEAKWMKHAGGQGPVLDPDSIGLDALRALLEELRTLHRSAQSRAGRK